ncbi:MAG TPA: hypothetical protein VGZ02_12320 [Candidatus Baltobacteraceae bacterium]|jgi:hypothetical protein|nr:hypothetical protein [Candidatus Baltobacteraceae bacterium]
MTAWRKRIAVIALVTGAFFAALTVAAIAQFSIPGLLNGAKDAAVRQALSQFGASIGDQLPIVVRSSDAYPTTSLPGAPFSPGPLPRNIAAAALRASRDGTIELPPGDYEFTVGVFCMRSYAHSPSGHRYLVAPLHGAAADVFTALNSRLPSFNLDHHSVQILSWNMQAGLPYDEMQPAQRAIVDRVIPDYKGRLTGDVYQRIQDQYQQIVGRVPGMPSFEDALGRLGTTGQAVLQLQRLREQMKKPPQSYDQLARELVPFASLIPTEAGGSGATPWSRYSDRVLVRFVTSGNYATPGTYQVRVLQPNGPDPPADVPFSNIVNNPGVDNVQPLTQSPQGGPQPQPQPTSTPPVSITSETVATIPADRTRTTVGVAEQVVLTFSGADAHWSVSGGAGTVDPSGKQVTYRASITPATETITATDTSSGQTATIVFQVIAPTEITDEYIDGTIEHTQGHPDIGMSVFTYFKPDTVSFQFIVVKELEAPAVADGVYAPENGMGHKPNKLPMPIVAVVPGKGSKWAGSDEVTSGDPGTNAPFGPGTITTMIPYVYAAANASAGPFYPMGTAQQKCMLYDVETLRASKAGANAYSKVSNPDNT